MNDLDADTREDASSWRSLDIASLEEIGFDDVLDRVDLFSEICCECVESLVLEAPIARRRERSEIGAVQGSESIMIDPELLKEGRKDRPVYMTISDREVITDVLHEAVGDAGSPSRSQRDMTDEVMIE